MARCRGLGEAAAHFHAEARRWPASRLDMGMDGAVSIEPGGQKQPGAAGGASTPGGRQW